MQFVVNWTIGALQKLKHSYDIVARRISPSADTTGPTIVYGFIGR